MIGEKYPIKAHLLLNPRVPFMSFSQKQKTSKL